jgi:hypothetical protein
MALAAIPTVPAELDEAVTGWDVVDAELPAEHPTSKAAATRRPPDEHGYARNLKPVRSRTG